MSSECVFNREYDLSELVDFVNDKISSTKVTLNTYVSTDNMIVDRGGVEAATKLPLASKFNHFKVTDTLFSNIRTYFRKVWLADIDGGASPDVLIFRTKDSDILEPTFLYYLLSDKKFADYTVLTSKGAKMPRGDKSAIMQYKIFLPEPKIQRKIGSTLRAFDKKQSINNQTNQTLEAIAQSLFKSWFVDFDPVKAKIATLESGGSAEEADLAAMRVIASKSPEQLAELKQSKPEDYEQLAQTAALFPTAMQESELGGVPEGWKISHLGSHLEIKRGGSPRPIRDYIVPEGYPWVKIADATADSSPFLFKTKEFIKEEGLKKTVYLKKGSLVLTNSATPGLPKFLELDACIHDGWLHFPVKNHFPDSFLYYLFLKLRIELVAQGNGSVFTNLKTDILKNQVVITPPEDILANFDLLVGGTLNKMKALCEESILLVGIRDILLPKLLSGEIDLSALNEETLEASL
jgi:type I restriction enzyme, S subunit